MYYLYILVAASAVGKSELLKRINTEGLWKTVPKYSTRDNRGEDDDVIQITDPTVLFIESKGDQREIRHARMEYIKQICGDGKGVVYYKNNNIYGVSINEIINRLDKSNLAIIISDFHAIGLLRENEKLHDHIRVMYIASTVDERELLKRYKSRENTDFDSQSTETMLTIHSIEKMCAVLSSAARLKYLSKIEEVLPLLNEQWNNYVPYFDTIKTRSLNIRMLYNRYIDNIADIDFALLNFYDLEYMFQQMRNVIGSSIRKKKAKFPPVFMVCAALSSGKATLMEIVGDLGDVNNNIIVTTKYAKRDPRPTDGRDGMIAIGSNGIFKDYILDDNDIWNWKFHNDEREYAVSHKDIKANIEKGMAQIFISNMSQIERAREMYPDNLVVLYLHATHETATKEHIQRKRKEECLALIKKELDTRDKSFTNDEIINLFNGSTTVQSKYSTKVESDLDEIRQIHNDFISHNHLINHVLLNTGTREDLIEQMLNLINHYKPK